MTRIAVIADVHGNAPALDAVLAEIEHESPDRVVLAGDAAGGLWQGQRRMPFQGPPGAFWLMLHPEPELRRTDYDVEATAEQIRASDYWDAENAATQLLDPPDPRELEELYERARMQRSSS